MVRRVLYINNIEIPLSEELSMPVTYQIADIAHPETRQGNYSKSIDVPRSNITDALFGYIFDVNMNIDTSGSTNFNPDFNPNLKANAKILADSIEEFSGFAQLIDITVIDRTDFVYHVTLLGKLTNLFDEIGDKMLTDLDFSEYNHTYNRTNVVNTWTSAVGQGYLYPLVDYGFSTDLTTFKLENLYPALSEREYLLKIFQDAGFVWDSNFLESDFFKRQYVLFNSPYMRLGATAILNRKFRASKTGTTSLTVGATTSAGIVFDDETTPPNFDTSSQYNNSTGRFLVATGLNGVFTFNAQIVTGFTLTPTTAGVSVKMRRRINAQYRIRKQTAGGVISTLASVTQLMFHSAAFTTTYTSTNPATSTDPDFSIPSTQRNLVYITAANVALNVGDTVYVDVFYYKQTFTSPAPAGDFTNASTGAGMTGTYTLHTYANSVFFNTIDNANLIEGMPVLMNDCLPEKIKQRDFVSTLIKKYNLYFEQDADQTNKFNIEPRPDYYNNTVVDWTQKLAQDRELKIIPMGALDFKHLTLKYKDDNDYFNTDYVNDKKESYGQRDIDINNDFVKNTKLIELIFSPTPSVGNASSNRIIPRIIKIDDNGLVTNHQGNLRSLYYSGVKSSNTTWYIQDSGGANPYNTYPYVGMVDDPYDPTLDIGFGVPLEIYWQPIFDDINFTNNNLYNRYYRDMILDIASPNSKIVEGWFNLNPIDIATLDFRKLYWFEEAYFRLNKVIDYDPISNELTKCEFIKVFTGRSFTSTTASTIGDLDELEDFFDGFLVDNSLERTPDYATPRLPNDNTGYVRSGTGAVYGYGNRIGADVKSYFIKGNNNTIGDYAENVTILDSSGVTIAGGVKNVTITRSNDVVVNEDNVALINNQYLGLGSSVATYAAGNNTYDAKARIILCDTSSGTVTVDLPDVATCTEPVYIYKTDTSTNGVVINPSGTQLIDGTSTSYGGLRFQYDGVCIVPDGTQWYVIKLNQGVKYNGSVVGGRRFINFKPNSTGLVATVTDNSATDSIDVTFDSSGTTGFLQSGNDLSDLHNFATARANLGCLGYIITAQAATQTPADSTTYYWGANFTNAPTTTATNRRIYILKAGTIKAIALNMVNGAGTSENSTMNIRLNNTTDTAFVTTIDMSTTTSFYQNTSLSIPVAVGDYIELKWVTPAWVTNPTSHTMTAYIYIE